jgi:hypothetical protein
MLSPTGAFPTDTLLTGLAMLPHFLPGGEALLYTEATSLNEPLRHIAVLEPATNARTRILDDAADARYLPTCHLIFGRDGALFAVPFDLRRRVTTGSPTLVLPDVMIAVNGYSVARTAAMQVAVSPHGHLVYLAGGVTPDRPQQLTTFDRTGRATLVPAGTRFFSAVRLSPGGERLAASITGLQPGLLVFDLARGSGPILTDPGRPVWPLWTPDGQRIVRGGMLGDSATLVWSPADGSRPAEPLVGGERVGTFAAFWNPEGTDLYGIRSRDRGLVRVSPERGSVDTVPDLPAGAAWFDLSPDGQWLAYAAPEPGTSRNQVFVQPWPSLDRRWQVSIDGGGSPKWTRDGQELLYTSNVGTDTLSGAAVRRVFAVPVSTGPPFVVGTPEPLFDAEFGETTPLRAWDASADGSTIYGVTGGSIAAPPDEPRILMNWLPTLRALGSRRGETP